MTPVIREQQSLESYATFWEEPVVNVSAPVARAVDSAESQDAYSEFVNVTEGILVPLPAERA